MHYDQYKSSLCSVIFRSMQGYLFCFEQATASLELPELFDTSSTPHGRMYGNLTQHCSFVLELSSYI